MIEIKINDEIIQDSYTLNLNEEEGDEFTFEVVSADEKGHSYRWALDYNADPNNIKTVYKYPNKFDLSVDIVSFKEESFIKLRNANGDEFILFIQPNEEASREKEYTFKISKHTLEDNTHTFNVISKEKKYKLDWNVTYKGEPLPLDIVKNGNKLIVTFTDDMRFEYKGYVVIEQEESGNILKLLLQAHTDGTIEYISTDE